MRQPTCPTFAGRALDRLLVITGYEGMDEAAQAADRHHGRTLLVDVRIRGLLEPASRLDVGPLAIPLIPKPQRAP